VTSLRNIFACARAQLPADPIACWASIFFSASVLTLLLSVAATQSFLALASLLYFVYLFQKKPQISFPPIKLPLALFCVWTVISMIWAAVPAAGGFEIRKLSLFLILLLTVNLVTTAKHLRFLYQVMFLESALAGIDGIEQFIKRYELVRIEYPRRIYIEMTVLRIHGFMGHWMNFGGQQMLVFAMLLGWLLFAARRSAPLTLRAAGIEAASAGREEQMARLRSTGTWMRWWWIPMILVIISIVLNLTRGIWLGCFLAAAYSVGRWKARWLWALPVLAAIFMLAAPRVMRRRAESLLHPLRDPSVAIRLQMWRVGWQMIERHPVVGVGPGNIPGVYSLYLPHGMIPIVGYHEHLHNDYIQFAAERGLVCLAAWLWFMASLGWNTLGASRSLTGSRWVAHGAFAAWLAFLVEGCFEFNFGTSPVLMVFLFVISTPFAAQRIEQVAKAERGSSASAGE
jgi:putative inorganic carbon (hco3(-)) transporter